MPCLLHPLSRCMCLQPSTGRMQGQSSCSGPHLSQGPVDERSRLAQCIARSVPALPQHRSAARQPQRAAKPHPACAQTVAGLDYRQMLSLPADGPAMAMPYTMDKCSLQLMMVLSAAPLVHAGSCHVTNETAATPTKPQNRRLCSQHQRKSLQNAKTCQHSSCPCPRIRHSLPGG